MLGAWGSRQLNDIQCYNSYQCLCETEGVAGFRVVVNLVASESIEAFMGEGGEARKAAVLNALIDLSGLTRSTVLEAGAHITVTPASVSIRAELPVADGNELATAFDSLSSGLASTGAASSALGLDITSVPTLMAMAPPDTPGLDASLLNTEVVAGQSASLRSALNTGAIIAIAAGSAVVAACVCLLLLRPRKKATRRSRIGHGTNAATGREMTEFGPQLAGTSPVGSPRVALPQATVLPVASAVVLPRAAQNAQEYELAANGQKVPMGPTQTI